MTEAKIKEEISLHLFSALAAKMGVASVLPRYDEGVDMILKKSVFMPAQTGIQFTTSGKSVDVQMKTTTRRQVEEESDLLHYKLNVKNYNDLIFRKDERLLNPRAGSPLLLVLHVLPDEESKWVEVDTANDFYKLNGMFYWFYPAPDATSSEKEKTSKEWLEIPLDQKIGLAFFHQVFTLFF